MSDDQFAGALCRHPALRPAFFNEGPLHDPKRRYVNNPALRLAAYLCARCPARAPCMALAARQDPRGAMYAGIYYPFDADPVRVPPLEERELVDYPREIQEAVKEALEKGG